MDRDLGCFEELPGGSGTPTGPMDHDFGSSKSFQEPPRIACGAPGHFKKPSDTLYGVYVKHPENPKCSQQASKDVLIKVRAAECAERLNNNNHGNNNNYIS